LTVLPEHSGGFAQDSNARPLNLGVNRLAAIRDHFVAVGRGLDPAICRLFIVDGSRARPEHDDHPQLRKPFANCSDHVFAAIDIEGLARHEVGVGRGQETATTKSAPISALTSP
jgi:hypothetical protein